MLEETKDLYRILANNDNNDKTEIKGPTPIKITSPTPRGPTSIIITGPTPIIITGPTPRGHTPITLKGPTPISKVLRPLKITREKDHQVLLP
jgi:hypothetical protein